MSLLGGQVTHVVRVGQVWSGHITSTARQGGSGSDKRKKMVQRSFGESIFQHASFCLCQTTIWDVPRWRVLSRRVISVGVRRAWNANKMAIKSKHDKPTEEGFANAS